MTIPAIERLFELSRTWKRTIQVLADLALMAASFHVAMALKLDSLASLGDGRLWLLILFTGLASVAVFVRTGFYRAVVRYITAQSVKIVALGIVASALLLFFASWLSGLPVPPAVAVIYALLAGLSVGGVRFAMRALHYRQQYVQREPVIIYGAGSSGAQLCNALRHGREFRVVAFVDDDRALHGMAKCGVPVYPSARLEALVTRCGARRVLLAMPSASRAARARILRRLEPLPVLVQTMPGMVDVVAGTVAIGELRDVPPEDLLGRDPVPPDPALMGATIRDRVVMVTGAGGSIGSELCRQIVGQRPRTLVLFERSEHALYEIERELGEAARAKPGLRIVPILGSVTDPAAVARTLAAFGVDTIYHAAAYKHVPIVEHNIVSGLRNNVQGTRVLAEAAIAAGVRDFILVSTDKAVRPTNVMGASKRLAELVCQALAGGQHGTRISMVRFGNVLGSSGSVIPHFRRQIASGGPVTVTHPEITRYFMTIPEAAQLVIQAGAMAHGGDVFVLDMGEPVKIAELAERMIRLHGLRPYRPDRGQTEHDGDVAITFIGRRPGEKLYEELLIDAASKPTPHSRIRTAHETRLSLSAVRALLVALEDACARQDVRAVRTLLTGAGIGYAPDAVIADLVWSEHERPDCDTADAHPPVDVAAE